MVLARNTVSGQIADVPPKILAHPVFSKVLEVVGEEAKPYNPVMYTPGTKEEKAEARLFRKKKNQEIEEEE